jgi:EAL domain-containing protein (putative c-di-GMP-specific phosphodiesterase class I)
MYRAKKSGAGAVCRFEPRMAEDLRARVGLETALRRSLKQGDIRPYYQPIVDLSGHGLKGFEILARWRDPELGDVSPEIFVPLTEQHGLILDLTEAMLTQACADAANWPREIKLSLNVSPVHLRDSRFPQDIFDVLKRFDFAPDRLEVEITETALLSEVDLVRAALARLRAAGIKVSLDDFGMGFSSLNHLRSFRIDTVKIDKSFVQTINTDSETALIVQSVVHLAKGLHLQTVAEGIEDRDVEQTMKLMGCDFGQGYLFGKAMNAEDALRFIGEQNDAPSVAAA